MDWDDGYVTRRSQYSQRSLRPTSYYSQQPVSPPNHQVPYGQLAASPGSAPTAPLGSGYHHLAVGPYQRDYYAPLVSDNPHQLPPHPPPEEFYEYSTGSRNNQYFSPQPEVPLGRVTDVTIVDFLDQDCIEPIIDLLSRMADPLSITASISTVAGVGIKLSTALYTLVDSIRSANIEIELVANEISLFSCTLDEIHEHVCSNRSLYSNNLMKNLKKLLETCTQTYAEIERILRVGKKGRSNRMTRNLMWALRCEKIRPMRLNLESLKTTLMVMLQTMKLAKNRERISKVEVLDNKKDKNSNLQARSSHKLQELQREERQYRSRAKALVVANYWAISRSEEAAQEANYQTFLTQSPDSNNSDSTETNQWLWQLVPYRPPQKPSQPSGHRHILPGAHRPSAPSKSIHFVASKTVNLLLNKWTNSTRKSENMKNGRSSSRRADLNTESGNGDVYSGSSESEGEERTLSLNENSEIGSSISSRKKGQSNGRSSSQNKDIERGPAVHASTGEELMDRDETRTVKTKPTVKMESKPPSRHNSSPKDITVPPSFLSHKSQNRTEDVRHSGTNHASTDPLETESASTGAQASPILEALSVSSSYLDSEKDNSDDVNLSDSARVVIKRRRSRGISRRSPDSAHRSARSAHSDSMATPKPYPPKYEANPDFGPLAHFPGPPQMQYGPAHLTAPFPYQAQYPPFPDPPVPPPVRAPSPEPPAPLETAEQIERLEKILVEYIARETASKEATEAAIAQERNAQVAQETEKEREEAKLQEMAKKQAEEEDKNQNEKKQVLCLKDAVGRKFRFPFHQCKTWDGISSLITTAFIHIELLGSHVANGHYDLVGPFGETILPTIWETVVEPGWSVSMSMWPTSETKDERLRTLAPEAVESLEESSPKLVTSSLNPSKRSTKREKPAVEEDEASLSSEDISVDERSQLLRFLEQVEVSDLQQWIQDKKRVLEEKSKQSKARETALEFYSGASDVGTFQQRFSRPEPSLEQSRDGGAFQRLLNNTEEQFKRVEQLLLENKRDQELKETAEQKLKEQAYIDHLKKQIEDKQADIDAREAAAQVEKEEEKYARLEKLIMDRDTPQQTIPHRQLALPTSDISESSKSTIEASVDVMKSRSFRSRMFSRGSSTGSVKR